MGMKQVAARRSFIKQTAAMTAGLAGFGMLPEIAAHTRHRDKHSWTKAGILTASWDDGFDADVDAGCGGGAGARNDEAGPRLPV